MKKNIILLFIACLPLLAQAYDVEIDGIYYNVFPNAKYAEVTSGDGYYAGDIVIPSSIMYEGVTYPVTKIGESAFQSGILFSTGPTSIIIPNSVTEIGNNACAYCKKLTGLIIPNSVTKIGNWAFEGCDGLTKFEIPNSVVEIGYSIFESCDNLTEVVIPSSIKEIGRHMFAFCRSLTKVVISDGITRINNYAFCNCNSLTQITIPNSITSIDHGAFSGCSALKTVTIGNGVTNMGYKAFADCPKLEDIYIYTADAPPAKYKWGIFIYDSSDMFDGSNIEYATLHVLKVGMNSYKTTYPWNTFGNIVAIPQEYQLTYLVDGELYQSYEIMQGTAIEPEAEPTKEGYTFSGWSEIPDIMPDDNVTVTGSFVPNKYTLTYVVDGITYQTVEIECDAVIPTNSIPTKEGYTFVTNDDIPKTMPAYDITITGSFVVNKYVVTYVVDGETYKTIEVEYSASIPQENAPVKEGYTFIGWDEIPDAMPAHDIMVTGVFAVNTYMITYLLDGAVYTTVEVEYGKRIELIDVPQKEGYIFMGWNNAPDTMPAYDIIIYGNYEIDTTGILDAVVNDGEYSIYTTHGVRVNTLQKGVNIIRTTDGQTKKVYVK